MKKKILVPAVASLMLLSGVVGGSLAYLMDTTEKVTNTFTVGNVDIKLEETTKDYKMVPGTIIDKNPIVTVEAESEDCWLFVKIEESDNLDDFISYTVADGWTELETGVYYREVNDEDEVKAFSVLKNDQVTVNVGVTKDDMDAIVDGTASEPTLSFTAYAVQKEGFSTAAAAWTEANK